MQDLKLNLAVSVNIDGNIEITSNIQDMFNILNIPNNEEYADARVGIIQKLLVFGELDLSPAYAGHTVLLKMEVQ